MIGYVRDVSGKAAYPLLVRVVKSTFAGSVLSFHARMRNSFARTAMRALRYDGIKVSNS